VTGDGETEMGERSGKRELSGKQGSKRGESNFYPNTSWSFFISSPVFNVVIDHEASSHSP